MNLRHAFRLLWKDPAFTLVAVFTLALGIGASTAIFTVINALLLRPLPYRSAGDLVLVTTVGKGEDQDTGCLTWPRFTMLQERNRVFARLAAYTFDTTTLTNRGDAEQLQVGRVTWDFFDVLGVRPAIGGGFTKEDGDAAGRSVVLIGDGLWRRKFHASPDVVGQPVTLGSKVYTVAGVLPASFSFGLLSNKIDVWIPRIDELTLMSREHLLSGVCYLSGVGRLAPGVSISKARAQMNVLGTQYSRENPKLPDAGKLTEVEPLREKLVGSLRPMLVVLAAAVAVVLLIACANVASLLLARALVRRREVAVRTALGATRGNLIRQLLTESLLLAVVAGACGIALSLAGTRLLAQKAADFLPRADEIGFGADPAILAFALGSSLLAGILFGLAPAIRFSRAGLSGILREEARGTVGPRTRSRLRNALVSGQVALSVVLLVAAGLLIRTFIHLQNVAPGVNTRGTLTMALSVPPAKYATGAQMIDFYEQVLAKVDTVPGVQAAAISSALPVNPARQSMVLAEGQPAVPLPERPVVYIQTFAHDYLRALGVPLIRGRVFDAHDTATSPAVAVINQAFARRFFQAQDPVGKHVALGRRPPAEIVGVIGDVRNATLTADAAPEVDVPFAQLPWPAMNLTIRSDGDPRRLMNAIRARIASVDRDVPVTTVQTLDDVLSASRAQPRLIMILLVIFAACAFILAVTGLYGIISYSVTQRTQEMGVRIALGASRGDVIGLVVKHGLALALIGIAVGLAASFVVTRLMASMMYGVTTTDPLTFLVSPLVFLLFAALASAIPALRATRVDPSEALRVE